MSNTSADAEVKDEVLDSANAAPIVETEAEPPVKKKGLPMWVTVLVILICLGIVGGVYMQMSQDKPTVVVKGKK